MKAIVKDIFHPGLYYLNGSLQGTLFHLYYISLITHF